ncbi:MAG: beta-lactamase family protein [Acidobacteria bacterium]|nr:beta-lactamase family protein [Acidobacteriota bacterium]
MRPAPSLPNRPGRLLGLAAAAFLSAGLQAQTYRGPALRSPVILPEERELGSFPAAPLPGDLQQGLDAALRIAQEKTKAPAITAAVAVPGRGLWTGSRGLDPAPPSPRLFYWASAGKPFTAVLVIQLIEEGKLTLATTIDRWFPDFPEARRITVEQLLSHTSGIFSWQQDRKLRKTPGYKTPERLIAIALSHPMDFAPGEHWSYSNTGYTMLGRIIEIVDGRSYADAVQARILKRLGLANTTVARPHAPEPPCPRPHPQASDELPMDTSLATPFAAGSVVASAEDMIRFWHGLLGGRLVSRAGLEAMFSKLYPMFNQRVSFYGLGVMVQDVPGGTPQVWLGHSGGTPGIKAEVAYSREVNAFAAVALNNDGSAQATINLLLRALRGEPMAGP